MTDFAKYAFNKAHAACYAVVAYRTAYLKYYYPVEFMAALITSVMGNTDKVVEYIRECSALKIDVLKPDINKSFSKFSVEGHNIRFGLAAVKNVGVNIINNIYISKTEIPDTSVIFCVVFIITLSEFNFNLVCLYVLEVKLNIGCVFNYVI